MIDFSFTTDSSGINWASPILISPNSVVSSIGLNHLGLPSAFLTTVQFLESSIVTSTPAMHRPPRFREFAQQTKYASILFLRPVTYFTILLSIRILSLIFFGICAKQFVNFRNTILPRV